MSYPWSDKSGTTWLGFPLFLAISRSSFIDTVRSMSLEMIKGIKPRMLNRVQANSTAPQAFHTPGVKLCPGYLMASQTASDPTLWCWKQEEWVLKSPRFSVRNIWSAYCFSWTTQCTSTEDELPFKKWEICSPLQYNFHNVIFKCT